MKFGKKRKNRGESVAHWDRIAAALEGVARASEAARTASDYGIGRKTWIEALLPHFATLGVSVPYFQSLNYLLAGLTNTQRGERLALVHRTRRAVAEATEHMATLARTAGAKKDTGEAKKGPSKRSQYARLAKAMSTPALLAQIESHGALLRTAEKTPETAEARREIKSELGALEREATRRSGEPKEPRTKKLKKSEMSARLHAREKAKKEPKAKKERETTNALLNRLGFTKEATADVPGAFGGGAHVLRDGKRVFTGTALQIHRWLKKQEKQAAAAT